MSSYAGLHVEGAEMGRWKDEDIDLTFLFLFTKDDIQRRAHPNPDGDRDDDDEQILLTSTASVLADRLDALGIGPAAVLEEFDEGARYHLRMYRDIRASMSEPDEYLGEEIRVLETLTLEGWVELLAAALKGPEAEGTKRSVADSPPHLPTVFGRSDLRVYLRAVLLACDLHDEIAFDVTDLFGYDWMEEDFDPQQFAIDRFSFELTNGTPAVVITEGSTDARILQSTIRIRYPHLESFIKFFDFTTDAEGSAAAGVRTLKSFAAAGISNRVVLLLDNDSAAKDALRALGGVKLPGHYTVMRYPNLEIARDYPTLGPNGLTGMDVNGMAGSIELYLGEDVLRDGDGELAPVQWRSYIEGVHAYQGEVTGKTKIQKRFAEKVKRARTDAAGQDWSGLDAIIEELLKTLRG